MSIGEVLVLTLTFAYLAVGVVGFLGWRSRMRSPATMLRLARPTGRPRAWSGIGGIRKQVEQ